MNLTHPYTDLQNGAWLRGNLHAHTTRSDGARPPEAVIDDYIRRGYGFLMISDHDITTTREECAAWSKKGIILIPGNEVSAQGPHLLHVDADRHVAPRRSRQEVLNTINACGAASGGRGFAVINHPDWGGKFDHCTIEQLREWTGYAGIEVYNGVIGRLGGSSYATNKWDMLLAEGRRVWGFAHDDSHAAAGDTGLGWNTAYVKNQSVEGVVEALLAGRFYASTGVTINSIQVIDDTIRIETENAQRITALADYARRFAVVDDRVIEVKVPPKVRYVRFECWGPGESFAWTQPFFVDEGPARGAKASAGPRFIEAWEVSDRISGVGLEESGVDSPDKLKVRWSAVSANPAGENAAGLVDGRNQIEGVQGLVFFRTTIKSDAARRARLYLGYDGPVRVWLNDRQVFEGPGANPALPDKTALYASLRPGENRLVIALDTNEGQAWGVIARVE